MKCGTVEGAEFYLAVISARRPANVPKMIEQLGYAGTWFVPHEDEDEYEAQGVQTFVAEGLVGARNAALDEAENLGLPCIQVSDDLKGIKLLRQGEAVGIANFPYIVTALLHSLEMTDMKLAGCSPTDNPFYGRETESSNLFILGDLFLALPCEIRFDARFKLKEDYDYTCQHYAQFGGAKRLNWILPSFQHRTNKGGAVAYRTAEYEQEAIALLRKKWGDWVQPNPKRENEVLLKLPKRRSS